MINIVQAIQAEWFYIGIISNAIGHSSVAPESFHQQVVFASQVLENGDDDNMPMVLEDSVTQHIEHAEEAAIRDLELLSRQADTDFASDVSQRIHFSSGEQNPSRQSASDVDDVGGTGNAVAEEVHLLRFGSGDGQRFRQSLLEGPQQRVCRQEIQ